MSRLSSFIHSQIQVTTPCNPSLAQSCVKNIESTISGRRGVKAVSVSLEQKEARVGFDPEATSPNEISDAIFDMGFNTKIKDGQQKAAQQKQGAPPSGAGMPAKGKAPPNGANARRAEEGGVSSGETEKCFLRVQGMTCAR